MNKQQQDEAVARFEATKYERCVKFAAMYGVTPENIDQKLKDVQENPNNSSIRQNYVDFVMSL